MVPACKSASVETQTANRILMPLLGLAVMLSILNQMSLGPLIPEMSRDLNVSVPLLGQVTMAIFFGSAVIGIFVGPLGDQYGKKRLIVLGLGVVFISAIGTIFAPDFGWLFAARIVSAVSGGLVGGAAMGMAGTLFAGDQRRKAMGTIGSGIAFAPIAGIPVLTFVASLSSWRASYLVLACFALPCTLLAYRMIPDDSIRDAGRIEVRKIVGAYRPLLGQRVMLVLLGSSLVRAIGWIGLLTYVGAFYADEYGLSVREIGWVAMFAGAAYLVGTKIGGGSVAGVSIRTAFGVTTAFCSLTLGFSMTLPIGVLTSVVLLGVACLASGIGYIMLLTLVSSETEAGQSTTMSLNTALFTLGAALGAAAGGGLIFIGGYLALGYGLMGFMLISALLVWRPGRAQLPVEGRSRSAN